ncbi:unnamed protein product [Gordionus sp. m RMFG-2023]|uniref:alkylated DNA repair protein alkB homolog 8-like n=1 Tax=Gordionus sp. m RMFG-2023 TaxID=3053472 RepID=UPI0030E5C2C2
MVENEKHLIDQALNFEKKHVHKVYHKIAHHFDHTRYKAWPKIVTFLKNLSPYSLILDIGSGNGKYLHKNEDIFMVCLDRCSELNIIARNKGGEVIDGDILSLPFKYELFDHCICIAVLHHLSTKARRISALQDIIKVLKIDGTLLIYVWAFEQENFNKDRIQDLQKNDIINIHEISVDNSTIDEPPSNLNIHKNRTQFLDKDLLVPWNLNNKCLPNEGQKIDENIYYRFYHVFTQNEMQSLLSNINNIQIIESYYDKGNWAFIIKKIKLNNKL